MRPVEKIRYKNDTIVKIGQPANYPIEIVRVLNEEFSRFANINSAYLGWLHDPSSDIPPHLIIGLDLIGDINHIIQAVNRKIEPFLKETDLVDFLEINSNEGIMGYLSKTKPFYKR